jgi:hypothetical protein
MIDSILIPVILNVAFASLDCYSSVNFIYPGMYGEQEIVMPETGPAKYIVGDHPTLQNFLIAGAIEVVALSALSYGMKRLGWKQWWIPQVAISTAHGFYGIRNIYTRNKWLKYGKKHGYY